MAGWWCSDLLFMMISAFELEIEIKLDLRLTTAPEKILTFKFFKSGILDLGYGHQRQRIWFELGNI